MSGLCSSPRRSAGLFPEQRLEIEPRFSRVTDFIAAWLTEANYVMYYRIKFSLGKLARVLLNVIRPLCP